MIKYQGWRAPIVVSKDSGFIIKGHGKLLSARYGKMKKVPVEYQSYKDSDQEYADLQGDNGIAAWSSIDYGWVNDDLKDLDPSFDVDMLGFKDFEIEPADKYADKDADETPELKKTKIKIGHLFQLGDHRLLCGDATKKEDVERLMDGQKAEMVYTDPPYGISLNTDYAKGLAREKDYSGRNHRNYKKVYGDDKEFDPSRILNYFENCKDIFLFGANYFIGSIPSYRSGSWVVWLRATTEGMESQPGTHFELCWSKQNHQNLIARIAWKGAAGHSIKDDGQKKTHPTQKPVKLAEWFFDKWGKDKKNIVDLYLGSGTTLIACEKTERKCYGMEIDPQYCQVIIDRWEKFTDKKADKL